MHTRTDAELLEAAIALAVDRHRGQRDVGGVPYIVHCLKVMCGVETVREMIAAVLHDTIEDTDLTLEDLRQASFDEEIVEAVDLLTRREGETRMENAQRIVASGNLLALKAKISDNKQNQDPDRYPHVTPQILSRCESYKKIGDFLESHLPK